MIMHGDHAPSPTRSCGARRRKHISRSLFECHRPLRGSFQGSFGTSPMERTDACAPSGACSLPREKSRRIFFRHDRRPLELCSGFIAPMKPKPSLLGVCMCVCVCVCARACMCCIASRIHLLSLSLSLPLSLCLCVCVCLCNTPPARTCVRRPAISPQEA